MFIAFDVNVSDFFPDALRLRTILVPLIGRSSAHAAVVAQHAATARTVATNLMIPPVRERRPASGAPARGLTPRKGRPTRLCIRSRRRGVGRSSNAKRSLPQRVATDTVASLDRLSPRARGSPPPPRAAPPGAGAHSARPGCARPAIASGRLTAVTAVAVHDDRPRRPPLVRRRPAARAAPLAPRARPGALALRSRRPGLLGGDALRRRRRRLARRADVLVVGAAARWSRTRRPSSSPACGS